MILVVLGAVVFVIGAVISIVVALRTDPDDVKELERAGRSIPIGKIIPIIFKYGGAGAPIMVIGLVLVGIGLPFLGVEVSW
jgi:hypothetical protein